MIRMRHTNEKATTLPRHPITPAAIAGQHLFLVGLLLALPGAALAHVTKVSSVNLEITDGAEAQVSATIQLNGADLQAALPDRIFIDDDGVIDPTALAEHAEAITAYVLDHARITAADDMACVAEAAPPMADDDHVLVRAIWTCPDATGFPSAPGPTR